MFLIRKIAISFLMPIFLMLYLSYGGSVIPSAQAMNNMAIPLWNTNTDTNIKSKSGWTALMYAIQRGGERNIEIVKLLLSKGADTETVNKFGRTALIAVIDFDRIGIVKLLLDKGANVNTKDKYGRTALTYAKMHGYTQIIRLLKDAGAKK